MSKQALGNVLAGVAFLIVAIVDFTRESSGIGAVFLVFAAVFLGLGPVRQKAAATLEVIGFPGDCGARGRGDRTAEQLMRRRSPL
jgi:uncharacterized membrane protein YfcA